MGSDYHGDVDAGSRVRRELEMGSGRDSERGFKKH